MPATNAKPPSAVLPIVLTLYIQNVRPNSTQKCPKCPRLKMNLLAIFEIKIKLYADKENMGKSGCEDLERTTQSLYTELGFKPNGASKELTSFFVGENNFVIHFFLRDILQSNVKRELADLKKGNEVIFTLSAESKEEVDNWAAKTKS